MNARLACLLVAAVAMGVSCGRRPPPAPVSPDEALVAAALANDAQGMRRALARGADPNSREGSEAMMHAVADLRALRLLVRAGARTTGDRKRTPAIVHAGSFGTPETIDFLLAHGSKVNELDPVGASALYYAARALRMENVDALLRRGADPNGARPGTWTPLHGLGGGVQPADEEMAIRVARILVAAGARADVRDRTGQSPSDYARKQSPPMLRLAAVLDAAAREQRSTNRDEKPPESPAAGVVR